MTTKRKLKSEIVRLTYRVQELEEKLCPCEQHDFVCIEKEFTMISGAGDFDILRTLKCRKCGKVIKKYDWA